MVVRTDQEPSERFTTSVQGGTEGIDHGLEFWPIARGPAKAARGRTGRRYDRRMSPRPGPVGRAVGLLVVAGAFIGAAGCGDDDGGAATVGPSDEILRAELSSAGEADEGIDGVEAFRVESADHTDADVEYPVTPAPGGPHHQVWANCGFYDEPIAEEHLVHDLEHGAVWLAYPPDLPVADVEVIRALVADHDKVVAAPFDGLADGEAVVASAWARQLRLDSVDDPRLERFVVQYQDGGQAPEAGVTCRGTDVGEPLE